MTKKQKKYIKARAAGKNFNDAKRAAGYNLTIPSTKLEPQGGPVWLAIRAAVDAHGLTDDFIASELKKGIERSEHAITRFNPKTGEEIQDPDLAAHDRYLGRICKIKGYERERSTSPAVAVQINNNSNNNAGTTEGITDREAEIIINALRAEISARESADILEGSVEDASTVAHTDVDGTVVKPQETIGD